MMNLPLSTASDFASAVFHMERLSKLWMHQVVVEEGITEPATVIARMVELDNERLSQAIEELADAQRGFTGPSARRGQMMIKHLATKAYEGSRA